MSGKTIGNGYRVKNGKLEKIKGYGQTASQKAMARSSKRVRVTARARLERLAVERAKS